MTTHHAGHAEVKLWALEPCLLEERDHKATQAAVDVEADLVLERELAESGDLVNRAVGEVGSRADDHDRVGVAEGRSTGGDSEVSDRQAQALCCLRRTYIARLTRSTRILRVFSSTGIE